MDAAGYLERAEVLIVSVVDPLDRIELEPRSHPETNHRGHCYSHRWSLGVEQPEMERLMLKKEKKELIDCVFHGPYGTMYLYNP